MPWPLRTPQLWGRVFGQRASEPFALAVQGELRVAGATGRTRGVRTAMPSRYELTWTAGQRGHPCIANDIGSGTEATREPADPDFIVVGTNAASTCSTWGEGGIVLTTTTGANDQVIVAPHTNTAQSGWQQVTWGTDQQTEWECFIKIGATITSYVVWAGLKLTNTSVVATDNDQAMFRCAVATDAYWHYVYSIGGTDVDTATGITMDASTQYHLKIEIDSARVPRFFINGVHVATGTAMTDATDLIPYIGVQTTTTAARTLGVYGQSISRVAA